MRNIRVITDSACDLSTELVKKYGITVIPLNIHIGDETFVDRSVKNSEFYKKMSLSKELPKTSHPSTETFLENYEGDEDLIVITVSSQLSSTYYTASLAQNMCEQNDKTRKIAVIDSEVGSIGQGQLAVIAAKLIEEDRSFEEIVDILEKIKKRIIFYGVLENLDNAIKNSDDGQVSLSGDIQASYQDHNHDNGIVIDKSVTIEGNNHKINLLSVFQSESSRAFYVSGNLTLKNLEINNGHVSGSDMGGVIYVTSTGKLTVTNVTFVNSKAFLGSAIYNSGTAIVQNSTFRDMDAKDMTVFGSVICTDTFNAKLYVSDSIFKNNVHIAAIYSDTSRYISVYNSVFENNTGAFMPIIQVQSVNEFIVDSCTFMNNKRDSLISPTMANFKLVSTLFMDNDVKNAVIDYVREDSYIDSNVFIGNNKNNGVVINSHKSAVISNNYFGTNDASNKVIGSTPINNIQLHIVGENNIDYNNLSIANYTHVFAYLSGNTDKLPVFNVNIASNSKIKLNQSQITFKDNIPAQIDFLPIKSGAGSIVIGSNYDVPLNIFNFTVEYIILKKCREGWSETSFPALCLYDKCAFSV